MVCALGVQLTFTAFTRYKSVADVASRAGAHGPLGPSAVVSGSALGVSTARVGLAKVTGFERPAVGEGVSGHVSWAGADWGQSTEMALGVGSAGVDTGVHTGVVDASGLVAGALAV